MSVYRRVKRIVAVVIFFALFFSCVKDKNELTHGYISFVNNSEDTVYILQYRKDDMLWREYLVAREVLKGDTICFANYDFSSWEVYFEYKSDTIKYFVFSSSLLLHADCFFDNHGKKGFQFYPCKELGECLLKCYRFTERDLNGMNWVFAYP